MFLLSFFPVLGFMMIVTPSQEPLREYHGKISKIGSSGKYQHILHRARLSILHWACTQGHQRVCPELESSKWATTFRDQTSLSFQTYRIYIQRNETIKQGQSFLLTIWPSKKENLHEKQSLWIVIIILALLNTDPTGCFLLYACFQECLPNLSQVLWGQGDAVHPPHYLPLA